MESRCWRSYVPADAGSFVSVTAVIVAVTIAERRRAIHTAFPAKNTLADDRGEGKATKREREREREKVHDGV